MLVSSLVLRRTREEYAMVKDYKSLKSKVDLNGCTDDDAQIITCTEASAFQK
jgi:hypothetical protein